MRAAAIVAIFAALASASGLTVEEPIPPITTSGWGPVRIGMALDDAASALQARFEELPGQDAPELENCRYVRSDRAPGLLFMVWRKHALLGGDPRWHVVRIDTSDPRYTTYSGVRVGDSEAAARNTYAGRSNVRPHPHVPEAGVYLSVSGPTGSILLDIQFGHVAEIRTGWGSAVGRMEGCL